MVDLISATDLFSYFTLNETNGCPITSIIVYDEDETLVEDGDDFWTLFDLANRDNDTDTL